MTMNPTSRDLQAKKETDPPPNFSKFPSSSRHWSNNKNPRIVRVSRTFGGKDRHSKVCTVKGLRDRRIRLSVPTAIQLYDLQDKLGLGQPSKVVDWLLDATKDDINKLPPLPVNFTQFQEPIPNYNPHHHQYSLEKDQEKNKWSTNVTQNQEGFGGFVAQNLFPISNYQSSSFPNMPYSSNYFHWDPQNLSLSQFGEGYSFSSQTDQDQQQSSNFLGSNSNSQLYFCPSSSNMPSTVPQFPSFITPYATNVDMRSQVGSKLQLQNSVAPTTLHLIDSPENNNGRRDKGKRHS